MWLGFLTTAAIMHFGVFAAAFAIPQYLMQQCFQSLLIPLTLIEVTRCISITAYTLLVIRVHTVCTQKLAVELCLMPPTALLSASVSIDWLTFVCMQVERAYNRELEKAAQKAEKDAAKAQRHK